MLELFVRIFQDCTLHMAECATTGIITGFFRMAWLLTRVILPSLQLLFSVSLAPDM